MSEFESVREHLEELRRRLLRIVLAVGIITVLLLTVHVEQTEYAGVALYYPVVEPLDNMAAQITSIMRQDLVPDGVSLIQTAPGQAFFAQVYVAALVGVSVSMPIIIREMIGFVRPALRENEVHVGRSITVPAVCLFVTGAVFAYFLVIPYILDFLYMYGMSAELVTFFNVMDFITFVLQFLLAFGLAFQLPLVMYAVTACGVTDARFWRKNLMYAILAIVVFGAAITPDGSGVTMWFVGGPMIALYVAGMAYIERSRFA